MRQSLLSYLASLALASGLGLVPGDLDGMTPDDAAVGEEPDDLGSERRQRLLSALAQDDRPRVRESLAEYLGGHGDWSSTTVELLDLLVGDVESTVRSAAVLAFAVMAEGAPILDRLEVTATWATSPEPWHRVAAAQSLAGRAPVPAADLMLSYLASDARAMVRRAALAAAGSRFVLSPATVREIAGPALHDRSRSVRVLARRPYATAAGQGYRLSASESRARLWGHDVLVRARAASVRVS